MLNPDQIDKLRVLLQTSGWNEVVKPAIAERGRQVQKMWAMMPSERPEPYKGVDDAIAINMLRGRFSELEWMLLAFENEVKVHDYNRRLEELERQPSDPANPDAAANP
jgi:hypothetical protein